MNLDVIVIDDAPALAAVGLLVEADEQVVR